MSLITESFQAPLKEKISDESGLVANSWAWFFRFVQDALYPLGVENSFVLRARMHSQNFASATDINTTTDIITIVNSTFFTGLKVVFSKGTTAPSPLVDQITYYIIKVTVDTFKLANTYKEALAGTAIDLTTTGSGTQNLLPKAVIDGMTFNKNGVISVIIEYYIQRITDASSLAKSFDPADVNTATNDITETSHGYYTGLKGTVVTTGTMPAPLLSGVNYWVIAATSNTYKLAASYSNAIAFNEISLTSQGTGVHTFTPIEDLVETSIISLTYDPLGATWIKSDLHIGNPRSTKTELTVNASGQVEYFTYDLIGVPSISNIFWRARTLKGKNVQYSTIGR